MAFHPTQGMPTRFFWFACTTITLVAFSSGLALAQAAQDPDAPPDAPIESAVGDEPWDSHEPFDLDETVELLFEDFDIVISASRSEQSSNMTSVPVSILDADDIHYSGVRELPELLAFIPGVDALQLDRNRWAIGVRGLHQTFSDRTLFLIDGRNASNPLHGGVDFQRLPIFLEDIKQIETVRGPGGAAWGANAFNGVINVIKKSPRETTGVLLSQRIGEHGDSRSVFRAGQDNGKLAWRLSGEINDFSATNTQYVVSGLVSAPAAPNDFLRSQRFALDAVYDLDANTSLEFGIGQSSVERGDSPFLALQLGFDEEIELYRAYAKLSRDFDSNASGYIQWYGTYQEVDRPSMYQYDSYDNNIDAQYRFDGPGDHRITVGGTVRVINLDIRSPRATDSLPAGSSSEQWVGVFVGDEWSISDSWNLESQLRLDWYSETTVDWSGRVALLRLLGDGHEHVLRVALAKAFRTPQTALRDLSSERLPLGGGLFGVNLIPAGEIDNEELYSFELGYTGRIRDGLTFRADGYVQYYQDLTGVISLPEPAPVVGRSFFTIDNIGSAKAIGGEVELKYQNEKASVSVWYAFNDFSFDITAQNARAFRPAKNKIGATARVHMLEWLTLNANYRYTDTTEGDTAGPVDAFHRLDLTATVGKPGWNTELQFGVLDVLDQTDLLIIDQTSTGIAQETPGQSFFVQLSTTF